MNKDREQRFIGFDASGIRVETRASGTDENDVRMLVGHGAVFNSDSEDMGFIEDIAPGAFRDAIPVSDVRALFNHDSNMILGRTKSGTLRLMEDDIGLRFEIDLPDTQVARDLVTSINRGDISGNSFSFTVAEDSWDHEKMRRTIVRVGELFDVGPVTYPAYPETVVSARALDIAKGAAEKAKAEDAAREREQYQRQLRAHELA